MLYLIGIFIAGTLLGTLTLLAVCVVLSGVVFLVQAAKLLIEEVQWLNHGIKELVVPEKKK